MMRFLLSLLDWRPFEKFANDVLKKFKMEDCVNVNT